MKIIFLQEEMTSKAAYRETSLLPIVILRKVVSDVSSEIDKLGKDLKTIAKISEVVVIKVECYCCGLQEECTPDYILRVKDSYSGKWVCGLCSEAVKDQSKRTPPYPPLPSGGSTAIAAALSNHRSFCAEFNSTTRMNPKLSFTSTMREIAKRSNLRRTNNNTNNNQSFSKIARISSCVPKLA